MGSAFYFYCYYYTGVLTKNEVLMHNAEIFSFLGIYFHTKIFWFEGKDSFSVDFFNSQRAELFQNFYSPTTFISFRYIKKADWLDPQTIFPKKWSNQPTIKGKRKKMPTLPGSRNRKANVATAPLAIIIFRFCVTSFSYQISSVQGYIKKPELLSYACVL